MKRKKTSRWMFLVSILMIVATAASLAVPMLQGRSPIPLGLDLAGGVTVTYRPDFDTRSGADASADPEALLAQAKEILASRLYRTLDTVPEVVVRGDQRIVVSLPAHLDHREALELVGKTHRLTMRLVVAEGDGPREGVPRAGSPGQDGSLGAVVFTGEMLDPRSVRVETGMHDALDPSATIRFAFAPPHDEAFAAFTAAHRGERMAILLNDEIEWVGTIEGEIRGPGSLSGGYSIDQATAVAHMLRSGTLPMALEVEGLSAVGPSLGKSLQARGLTAMAIALGLLFLVIALAYVHRPVLWGAGIASLLTLLVLLLGAAAWLDLTLDTVGMAGVVLSLGMGMDAFVLVFEGLLARRPVDGGGASPRGVARRAVERLYSLAGEGHTLLHANASTLAVVLLLLGSERLRAFALFIVVGIAASVVTMLFTRALLRRVAERDRVVFPEPLGWLRRARPGLFGHRGTFARVVGLFLIVTVVSAVLLPGAGPSLRLGADFVPGSQVTVVGEEASVARAVTALEDQFPELPIRQQQLGDADDRRFLLTLGVRVVPTGDEPEREAVVGAPPVLSSARLAEVLGQAEVSLEELESIDGKVSVRRLLQSSTALLFSFACLALYFLVLQRPLVSWLSSARPVSAPSRARASVLVGILLAVVLDLSLIVAGLAWLRLPFDLTVVAGMLTVIGYSVNDSVVLWTHVERRWADRVEGETARELVSRSVDAVLPRAFLTSLSTLVPALTLLIAGLTPLYGFAWVVAIGTLAGTASSLFVVGSFAARALRPDTGSVQGPRADQLPSSVSSARASAAGA